MDRPGQVPLVPLVARTDVDEERLLVALEERVRLRRRDLVDLGARLGEELTVRRHYFPEYSESWPSLARAEPGARTEEDRGRGPS